MTWIRLTAECQYAKANLFNFNYSSNLAFNTSKEAATGSGFRPCTFTYDGVLYGGIELSISDAELSKIEFIGSTNFGIFGLDYYNYNTSTVLNQEVYDSLDYTQYTLTKQNTYGLVTDMSDKEYIDSADSTLLSKLQTMKDDTTEQINSVSQDFKDSLNSALEEYLSTRRF